MKNESTYINFKFMVAITFIIINIIYFVRIVLELSLGMCLYTNSLESLHIVGCISAVVLFLISVIKKRSTNVSFFDDNSFVDLTSIYGLDFSANLMISLCALAYPFRLFLFAARYPQTKPIMAHLSAIVRIFPGMTALALIILFVAMGFTVCFNVILGHLVPEMNCILDAFLFTTSQSLFDSEAFLELI